MKTGATAGCALVACIDSEMGIGKHGGIPWELPADLAHFRRLTTEATPGQQNAVIMGRRTWQSLPPRFAPLPRRLNVVVSRNAALSLPEGAVRATSLAEALELAGGAAPPAIYRRFVIGGAELYAEALRHPACTTLFLTRLDQAFGCDRFFPDFSSRFELDSAGEWQQFRGLGFRFERYRARGDSP